MPNWPSLKNCANNKKMFEKAFSTGPNTHSAMSNVKNCIFNSYFDGSYFFREIIFTKIFVKLICYCYTDCYILSSIFRFVDALLQMVSSRNLHTLEDPAASDWQFVLETVDTFNKVRKLTNPNFVKITKRNIGLISVSG